MKRYFLSLGLVGMVLCTQSIASSSNLSDDEPSRQVKTSSRDSRVDPIVEKELAQHKRRIFLDKVVLGSMAVGVSAVYVRKIWSHIEFRSVEEYIWKNGGIVGILNNSGLWAKHRTTFRRMGVFGMMMCAGYLFTDIHDRKERLNKMKEPPIDRRKNSPFDWGNGV